MSGLAAQGWCLQLVPLVLSHDLHHEARSLLINSALSTKLSVRHQEHSGGLKESSRNYVKAFPIFYLAYLKEKLMEHKSAELHKGHKKRDKK